MASKKITDMPNWGGNQVPTDLLTGVDLSATVANQNVKSTLNDLFSVITKNITDGAVRWQGVAAPAVSTAGAGSIYFSTADNIYYASENGAAYVPLITKPAGSNKQIQFNNSGAFGGASGFEYQAAASPNVTIQAQNASYQALRILPFAGDVQNEYTFQVSDNAGTRYVGIDPTENYDSILSIVNRLSDDRARIAVTGANNNSYGATLNMQYSTASFPWAAARLQVNRADFVGSGLEFTGASASLIANSQLTGGLIFQTQASAPIIFATGGTAASTERVRIDNTGLVGINKTSSIGAQLHTVSGNSSRYGLRVDGQGVFTPIFDFRNSDNTWSLKADLSGGGSFGGQIELITNTVGGGYSAFINEYRGAATGIAFDIVSAISGGNYAGFAVQANNDLHGGSQLNAIANSAYLGTTTTTSGGLIIASQSGSIRFATNGIALTNERLTIDATGLVGINKTSSIGAQLHTVSGNAARIALRVDSANASSVAVAKFTDNTADLYNFELSRLKIDKGTAFDVWLNTNAGAKSNFRVGATSGLHPGSAYGFLLPYIGGSNSDGPGLYWSDGTYGSTVRLNLNLGLNFQGCGGVTAFRIRKGTDNSNDGDVIFDFRPNDANFSIHPFGTNPGQTTPIIFRELVANGTNYIGFKAPDSIASDTVWVLPSADGTNGQVLTTNGSNVLSFTDAYALLFTSTANATVSNTTAETTLIGSGVGSATINANQWIVGRTIRVKVTGYLATTSTPTLRIRFKIGSTTLADTGAQSLSASISGNEYFTASIDIVCRTTGATGTVIGQGIVQYHVGTGPANTEWLEALMTATATIDTTASQAINITGEWGTASASNTLTITNTTIERLL